jgi:hypothetical protein
MTIIDRIPTWCSLMTCAQPLPLTLAALLLAAPAPAQTADPAGEAKTLKERLSDKASDAQRVDNCRVPREKQGATPRPGCPAPRPAITATKPP